MGILGNKVVSTGRDLITKSIDCQDEQCKFHFLELHGPLERYLLQGQQ